jgi:hypothetical protein
VERRPALHATPISLSGPLRSPRQLLGDQSYGGHASIHDDATAATLGFRAGPIEGPTHFSQFAPLLATLWGARWFEQGCISAHYQRVAVQGEEVRAAVDVPFEGASSVAIRAEKADGTPVLAGTACVGEPAASTECERRLAAARPPERLVVLDRLHVGQRGVAPERVRMGFDDHCGELYPFTLAQKLAVITEPMLWYTAEGAATSPWRRPVVPLEMISVLATSTSSRAGFEARQPSVGLFLDQEIRLVDGPVFVDEDYELEREIVALSESRRTESYWTRTTVTRAADGRTVAVMLLHQGVLKESYPGYPAA